MRSRSYFLVFLTVFFFSFLLGRFLGRVLFSFFLTFLFSFINSHLWTKWDKTILVGARGMLLYLCMSNLFWVSPYMMSLQQQLISLSISILIVFFFGTVYFFILFLIENVSQLYFLWSSLQPTYFPTSCPSRGPSRLRLGRICRSFKPWFSPRKYNDTFGTTKTTCSLPPLLRLFLSALAACIILAQLYPHKNIITLITGRH